MVGHYEGEGSNVPPIEVIIIFVSVVGVGTLIYVILGAFRFFFMSVWCTKCTKHKEDVWNYRGS